MLHMTAHVIYILFCAIWIEKAHILLKNVKFLVDRFHVSKHTEDCCKPPRSDSPNCRYHPDFQAVKTSNTECAEECFRW